MTADSNVGFRHFHDQLTALKETLLGMSSKAEERTDLAVEALLTRDKEKANLVIEGDAELNALEMEVEQAAVELLALQQPMARDLRFVIGAIKVSNDLERVGDHAVNIAESALRLAGKPKVSIRVPEIEVMARRARKMLGDSLDAFIRADGARGRQNHLAIARAATGRPQPREDRRSRHQHRRGRGLSRRRQADQASPGRRARQRSPAADNTQ